MWEFLSVVLMVWSFLFFGFIFPIYVGIQVRRKGNKVIPAVIYSAYVIPPLLVITPIVALIAFFAFKVYRPNLEADMRLQMVNGFGTGFCGATDRRDDDTFITTEWLRLFFVPFVPIQSYRVSCEGTSTQASRFPREENKTKYYSIHERLPLHRGQVLKSYALLFSMPLTLPLPSVLMGANDAVLVLFFVMIAAYVVAGVKLWRIK